MKPATPASSTPSASPESPARAAQNAIGKGDADCHACALYISEETPVARTGTKMPKVSVIIPARNEEANIGRCLRSILVQQGIAFHVIVVDDHSADRTAEIARQVAREFDGASDSRRPQVIVMEARRPLPAGWTGKANALCSAMPLARSDWLLFTDADTEHAPGSLAAAVQEAEQYAVDMLSLSPSRKWKVSGSARSCR